MNLRTASQVLGVAKQLEDDADRKAIEQQTEEAFGKRYSLAFEATEKSAAGAASLEPQSPASADAEHAEDPFVKKALEVFPRSRVLRKG